MTDRDRIIEEAKRWIGAVWHHAACVPYVAADCGMILIDIYEKCGLLPQRPNVDMYPRDWALHRDEERYLGVCQAHMQEVDAPLPGDIAVWKIGRCFSHGAIVVDWPMIIHADVVDGVVFADASTGHLSAREVKFFSLFDGAA